MDVLRIAHSEDGLYALHLRGVTCHVLNDETGAVLIDTGLFGCVSALKRLWSELGLAPAALRAVLLTHGHLDHTRGLHAVKAWSGAPLYAHPAEQTHLEGSFPYRGWARVAGVLESVGRFTFGYEPVAIDHELADGDALPFWGGLQVVHLPGHTDGHCGFWSPRRRVLFAGDLFASLWLTTHRAPRILSTDPDRLRESCRKARSLDPLRVYPNHYRRTRSGEELRTRFTEVC